jgi:hypothetical protein
MSSISRRWLNRGEGGDRDLDRVGEVVMWRLLRIVVAAADPIVTAVVVVVVVVVVGSAIGDEARASISSNKSVMSIL